MANGHETREIKRIRNEILVELKVVYPGALRMEMLLRGLGTLFPALEFAALRRDLHYLMEKGYVERVAAKGLAENGMRPWRERWFRLTARGLEVAERCVADPALDEQS